MQNRFCKRLFFSFLHTLGIIELTSNTLKRFLMIFNLIPAFINRKKPYDLVNRKHGIKSVMCINIKTCVNTKDGVELCNFLIKCI